MRNIIFDVGNVLLEFKPVEILKDLNIKASEINHFNDKIFNSPEWVSLDNGSISDEEAKIIIKEQVIYKPELVDFILDNWYKKMKIIQTTVDKLKELKDLGYNIYYLSNFHKNGFDFVSNHFDFFKLFDGGVVSSKVGLMKPDVKIYKLIASLYKINPEEAIFIDDMPCNVEAAKKCNFKAILFEKPESFNSLLAKELES